MCALEIILYSLWLIPILIGVWYTWWSNKDDKKNEDAQNKPTAFLDNNPLRWEDVDFQRGQQPTLDSGNNDN